MSVVDAGGTSVLRHGKDGANSGRDQAGARFVNGPEQRWRCAFRFIMSACRRTHQSMPSGQFFGERCSFGLISKERSGAGPAYPDMVILIR